jgi:hypothetical protein
VIGVLCGLLVVALLVGPWYYHRRRNQRQTLPAEAAKVVDSMNDTGLTYDGGPTSPRSGPVSESTGMETVQDSMTAISSATPVTVELGGGAVYEMYGMSETAPYQVLFRRILQTDLHNLQDSSPVELPTQYNVSVASLNAPPQSSPTHGFPSPVSPQTPGSESGESYSPTSGRRPSSLSMMPPLSINTVVAGRMPLFSEYFSSAHLQRGLNGSEGSDPSVSSEGREGTRRIPGSDTIHEKE